MSDKASKAHITASSQTAKVIRIHGERLEELPGDLYIPPEALDVFLDSFQGPLDLLLYLIRKQNIEILDIPIAKITEQYMQYVELMRKFRLDLAAEYLLMAAMLAQIKSRMLLPRPEALDEEGEEDPRAALIQQLQQYEQFAVGAKKLEELPRLERDLFLSQASFVQEQIDENLPQATLNELVIAFRNAIQRAEQNQNLQISQQNLSMREKMVNILDRLQSGKRLLFAQIIDHKEGREGVVVSFIALLELVRDGHVSIVQNEAFSPIYIRAA